MPDNSFIAVPPDVADSPISLRRFLLTLVEQLDIAFGNRGDDPFATRSLLASESNSLAANIAVLEANNDVKLTEDTADDIYIRQDGTLDFTAVQAYAADYTFTTDQDIIAKKYADDNFTYNPIATDPTDLNQTIVGPTSAEVQAISDKVDVILAQLRLANII